MTAASENPENRSESHKVMEYAGYQGRVEFDKDAGLFHGHVVNCRDVITFQTANLAEVQQAFRDSGDDYLEFCKQRNEHPSIPSPTAQQ